MNREIKFRAWDSFKRNMYVAGPDNDDLRHFFWVQDDHDMISKPMQYTGLKDKNGKEIFEGDLLTNDSDAPLTVGWDDRYACFTAIDTEDGTDYGLLGNGEPQNYEVTGNIWES